MKIQDIDKAFASTESAGDTQMDFYAIPDERFSLNGVYYSRQHSRFIRMDLEVAGQINDRLRELATHTSGGRIRFSTDSKKLELRVEYDYLGIMSHMAIEGSGGFMLTEENGGEDGVYKMLPPASEQKNGYSATVALPGGKMRSYVLWFPLYNPVKSVIIGLEAGSTVLPGAEYKPVKPILYYGSSITQGGCACRPDNSYQAMICKWNNVDFINLGFSGNAKAEDIMVDYLSRVDCSLFVCDYDHNSPSADHLWSTHWRLYERYRSVRQDVPILFISSPTDAFNRQTERQKRKQIIKNTVKKARARGDNAVYFLDGEKLVGKKDRQLCTVDGIHPNDLGFYRMAKGIYKKITEIDSIFR